MPHRSPSAQTPLLLPRRKLLEMTGLGYLGTDMVLDRKHGPMLLELNARPGLAIQMTNGNIFSSAAAKKVTPMLR